MTDAESYESYHARQDEESYRRQLFLLGAAFGNPEIAKKLSKDSFANLRFVDAWEQITGKKVLGVSDYVGFMAREDLGIQDYERSNNPLSLLQLVARHCRFDKVFQQQLKDAVSSFLRLEWTRHKSADEKKQAIVRSKLIASSINKAFGEITAEHLGIENAEKKASQENRFFGQPIPTPKKFDESRG